MPVHLGFVSGYTTTANCVLMKFRCITPSSQRSSSTRSLWCSQIYQSAFPLKVRVSEVDCIQINPLHLQRTIENYHQPPITIKPTRGESHSVTHWRNQLTSRVTCCLKFHVNQKNVTPLVMEFKQKVATYVGLLGCIKKHFVSTNQMEG